MVNKTLRFVCCEVKRNVIRRSGFQDVGSKEDNTMETQTRRYLREFNTACSPAGGEQRGRRATEFLIMDEGEKRETKKEFLTP